MLEGLPINQYKEAEITIGPSSTETKRLDKDEWMPPMPRDSHMLPEHSQAILRAARSGRIYKPPAPPEEDKDGLEEEDEHKEVPQGFSVKKWVKVPRHLEDAEPEYLAKRRKGLPSQYVANGQAPVQPAALRETKVKKTDAEGNVSVYKVLVPEGQAVEGEIQATDAIIEAAPVAAAPGTIVEGVGVVNAEGVVVANDILQQTPPRRRPAPPRKKRKSGPGRGKKKVVFVEGAPEQGTPASGAESGLLAPPGGKLEDGSVEPSEGGDTPMPDAGDEEEGSGEEGSEDEEQEEGTHSPTPALSVPPPEIPVAPTSAPESDPPKEPSIEAPVDEAPVDEAPMDEAPVDEAPVDEAPADATPVDEALANEALANEAPMDDAPVDEAPVNEAPVDEAPVDEAPVDEAPVDETPTDETPMDEAPVDEAPVDEAPMDEAPPTEVAVVSEPPAPTPVEPTVLSSIDTAASIPVQNEIEMKGKSDRDPSSSPELPLSAMAHSRQNSLNQIPTIATLETSAPVAEPEPAQIKEPAPADGPLAAPVTEPLPTIEDTAAEEMPASDGELDLLGSLERQLDKDSESMVAP